MRCDSHTLTVTLSKCSFQHIQRFVHHHHHLGLERFRHPQKEHLLAGSRAALPSPRPAPGSHCLRGFASAKPFI